jgi:hypothetical protein
MGLKFRRGTTAQKSGSLAFGEPYVNTDLGTLQVGGTAGDITLGASGTGSQGSFAGISGSSLDITGNAKIDGNLRLGGNITIGDNTADNVTVVASLSSSLIPSSDSVFDLGSPSKQWRDLYLSSASLYIDGTQVISSNATELIFTTDTGQGIKFNELGTDNITMQTVDGDIELKSSGGGDVLLDPTTGIISVKGNVSMQDGTAKFLSSGGTNIVFGNDLVVTGSITTTGAINGLTLSTLSSSISTTLGELRIATGSSNIAITNINSYTSSLKGALSVTGSNLTVYGNLNIEGTTTTISASNLSITDNLIYLNEGSNITNPDLGWTGNYNDGTYRHAGMFRDASDSGIFKIFKNYTPEPSQSIDTAHGTFALADLSVGTLYGSIASTNGVVSGSSQITYASISSIPAGIVSGSSQVSLGSASGNIALATQTTGDYVASLVASTGVTITNNSGENATPSIAIGQAVATSSNVQFNSLGVGMAASATAGRIDATNDVVAFSSSDIRFKENIVPIENALDKISKISGNTYDWKAENKIEHGYEGNDVGVIAQEIEAVLPQLVQTRESGFKAVKYDKLVALLIEGIKEQQTQIHSLTIEIEKLKESKGL